MGTHMKTTIEISDPLLEQAKNYAAKEKITLRALVEQGLTRVLAESVTTTTFCLRKGSFRGEGVQPDIDPSNWSQIRQRAYEGHGG